MPQLKIEYLYRDASNYKNFGSAIIPNYSGITAEAFAKALRVRFANKQVWPDILHFQPEVLGWPTLYFDSRLDDDLDLHEVVCISETSENVTFS